MTTRPPTAGAVKKRLPFLLLVGGVLLIFAWLGLKAWRVARLAQSLQARQAAAETLADAGLANAEPDDVEALVLGLRSDMNALHDELRIFLPLASGLGWLPKVGPLLEASPQLLEMADSGSEAAAYAMRGLKPVLQRVQDGDAAGNGLLPALLPLLEQAEPDLLQASHLLERTVAARAAIDDEEALPGRVQTLLQSFDERSYLLEDLRFLTVLPEFMGYDQPRSYLIMAQNEDELRASGGFLTGAGLLTLNQGEIVALQFQDGNLVDAWDGSALAKPYDEPPPPLFQLMGLELFLFRDANFWPHFPASAEKAMELYSYGQDLPPLDGAIAIDQEFLSLLLALTGPIEVADLALVLSRGNIVNSLRQAWQIDEGEQITEWAPNRKDFLGPLSVAIKDNLLNNLAGIDFLYAAAIFHEAVSEKHIQLYARDPEVAGVLSELGWDGRQPVPSTHDYLMVVDSNLGYNKVNSFITKTILYEVTLDESGSGTAELALHYTDSREPDGKPCNQYIDFGAAADSYGVLLEGCYWNYLRVYTPSGSTLLQGSEFTVPRTSMLADPEWPAATQPLTDVPTGLATFTNFLMLPRGQSLDASYRYQLPVVATEDGERGQRSYQLYVSKQAGASAAPLQIRVTLPAGAAAVEISPAPARVQDQVVTFLTTLDTDRQFTVRYR